MEFYKETIMGQVLHQVNEDESNRFYIDQIDDLVDDINHEEYNNEKLSVWNKNGLLITDLDVGGDSSYDETAWILFETECVDEYSWLVHQLNSIYNPSQNDKYRLNTTIGFLFEIYSEKYDDLIDIFKMVTIVSAVFLHPDHMGYDKFIIHPINLPEFGDEF